MKSLVRNCSGSLAHLEIHGFAFEKWSDGVGRAQSLLNGLKKMVLLVCVISDEWFYSCQELVELVLIDTVVSYSGVWYQPYSKLESLVVNGSPSWVNKGLHLFLQQCNQLKSFEVLPFKPKPMDFRSSGPYSAILANLPSSVECLKITFLSKNQLPLLHSLKKLQINLILFSVATHDSLSRLTIDTLEHLEIDAKNIWLNDQHATSISNLRNLKVLKLNIGWNVNIADMLGSMTNLSELHLGSYTISLDGNDLLHVVQHCQNLEQLILSFIVNQTDYYDIHAGEVLECIEALRVTAKTYQKMLEAVLSRLNGKHLSILIIGPSSEVTEIDFGILMNAVLKITRLSMEDVARILCFDIIEGNCIKITDENLKTLRMSGLFP